MSSTLSKEVLLKHKKNNVFVETGTLWGDGVAVALECGYDKVISIEIDPDRVAANSERFADEIAEGRVELVEGDTFDVFEGIVEGLEEPATFWLMLTGIMMEHQSVSTSAHFHLNLIRLQRVISELIL